MPQLMYMCLNKCLDASAGLSVEIIVMTPPLSNYWFVLQFVWYCENYIFMLHVKCVTHVLFFIIHKDHEDQT